MLLDHVANSRSGRTSIIVHDGLSGPQELPHDVVPDGEPRVVGEGGGGARGEDGGGGHQLAEEAEGVVGEVAAVGGLPRPQQAGQVAPHLLGVQ